MSTPMSAASFSIRSCVGPTHWPPTSSGVPSDAWSLSTRPLPRSCPRSPLRRWRHRRRVGPRTPRYRRDVRRYLVVANQTLGGDHLMEKVRECMAAGPCPFQVLVPATDAPGAMQTEARAHREAHARLDAARARSRGAGAEVTGRVGDARPMEAIRDVLLHEAF